MPLVHDEFDTFHGTKQCVLVLIFTVKEKKLQKPGIRVSLDTVSQLCQLLSNLDFL